MKSLTVTELLASYLTWGYLDRLVTGGRADCEPIHYHFPTQGILSKSQRRGWIRNKSEEGASTSNFHTRTWKIQVSNLPWTAETSPYTKKEDMTQQIRKVLQQLGRTRALSGSTSHSPPPPYRNPRKTYFIIQKKKKKTRERLQV